MTPILDTDARFFDALLAADHNALAALLHEQFLIVDVNAGDVTGRPEFLEFVASGQVKFDRIETFPDDTTVRILGDTAIVVGRTTMSLTMPDGTLVSTGSRYTHVYVHIAGKWQLVSAQGTPLPLA